MEINSALLRGIKGAPSTILIHMLIRDGYVTKNELCRYTGMSRSTIEKAVDTLRDTFLNEVRYETYILNNQGREFLKQPPIEGLDPEPPKEHLGFVYYIINGEYVKIGHSKDPNSRLAEMNSASPVKLKVNGAFEGSPKDEKDLHQRFKHLNHRGEWFLIDEELKSLIDQAGEEWKKNFFPTTSDINLTDINNSKELKAVVPKNFSQDVYNLLKPCGIGEPMLTRLSSMEHMTLEYTEAHISLWRKEGKAVAILIHRLRNQDAAPVDSEAYDPDRYTKGKYADHIKS